MTESSLAIDGVSIPNSAITVRNLWTFWQPPPLSVTNIRLAGVTGETPRTPLVEPSTHSLELIILGTKSTSGTPDNDWPARLKTNIDYIRQYYCNIPATANGTRTATLTLPSGSTITGSVHVLGLTIGEVNPDSRWCFAILEISIPAGSLA